MKSLPAVFSVAFSFLANMPVDAQSADPGNTILAQRGKGHVTQEDFTARANKIPAKARFSALRDSGRLRNVLNTLLLRAQLAADAREAGYDQDKIVQDRMRLAADTELAEAWLQHYVELQPTGDYERLAREKYELNKQDMLSTERLDVSHILISIKERSSDEARELAESVSKKVQANPALFDEMVETYSEDQSKSSNKGHFHGIKKGDMVEAFEDKAFSMKKAEISAPVETQYGFHIIRLDAYHEPEVMSFEAVKDQLIEAEQNNHEERIRQEYLSSLSALDVQMTKEALEEMVRRQLADVQNDESGDSDAD